MQAAISSFRELPDRGYTSLDDFPSLLVQEADRIPRSQLLALVDLILDQAQKPKKDGNSAIVVGSKKQTVVFHSTLEFRKSQLLPLMEKLDPDRATVWSKTEPELATKAVPTEDPAIIPTTVAEADRTMQENPAARGFHEAMTRVIKTQPEQAIAQAKSLTPAEQAGYLGEIVTEHVSDKPSIAEEASKQMLALSKRVIENAPSLTDDNYRQIQEDFQAMLSPMRLPQLWRGHPAQAARWCAELPRLISGMEKRDTDPENPNSVPKPQRPSTVAAMAMVDRCAGSNEAIAAKIIMSFDDPEIRLLLQVLQKSALLQGPQPRQYQYRVASEDADFEVMGVL